MFSWIISLRFCQVLGGLAVGAGDEDDSDVDSDSSTRSHCSNDNWFSADELSSDEGQRSRNHRRPSRQRAKRS